MNRREFIKQIAYAGTALAVATEARALVVRQLPIIQRVLTLPSSDVIRALLSVTVTAADGRASNDICRVQVGRGNLRENLLDLRCHPFGGCIHWHASGLWDGGYDGFLRDKGPIIYVTTPGFEPLFTVSDNAQFTAVFDNLSAKRREIVTGCGNAMSGYHVMPELPSSPDRMLGYERLEE